MRKLLVLIIVAFGFQLAKAQDADSLESLTLPVEDSKSLSAAPAKGTELALPGSTATSSIGKASSGGGIGGKAKENVGAILDFEGEVIEGERRRPDLFLQISIDNIKFDSLIYNRDDFNDYLEVDRKSRTRFLKMK